MVNSTAVLVKRSQPATLSRVTGPNGALLHIYLVLLSVHLKHGDVALPVDLIPRWVLPRALCLDATQRASGLQGLDKKQIINWH